MRSLHAHMITQQCLFIVQVKMVGCQISTDLRTQVSAIGTLLVIKLMYSIN